MNINLTINVDHPEELPRVLQHLARSFGGAALMSGKDTGALNYNVDTQPEAKPKTAGDEKPAKPRGRPAKAAAAPAEEFNHVDPDVTEEVKAALAPPADAPAMEKKDVQKLLIAVVQKHGAAACGSLCKKYGAPNLSGLDPDVYEALAADARTLLETEAAG